MIQVYPIVYDIERKDNFTIAVPLASHFYTPEEFSAFHEWCYKKSFTDVGVTPFCDFLLFLNDEVAFRFLYLYPGIIQEE